MLYSRMQDYIYWSESGLSSIYLYIFTLLQDLDRTAHDDTECSFRKSRLRPIIFRIDKNKISQYVINCHCDKKGLSISPFRGSQPYRHLQSRLKNIFAPKSQRLTHIFCAMHFPFRWFLSYVNLRSMPVFFFFLSLVLTVAKRRFFLLSF